MVKEELKFMKKNIIKKQLLYRAVFFMFLIITISTISCNNYKSADSVSDIAKKINPRDTERIQVISTTFLGNFERNYYGDSLPSKLDVIWQLNLGTGVTRVSGKMKQWSGAGWTGQPLFIREDSSYYLIQGSYDHHLRKINAETGDIVWKYKFDDVIKGTGSIWVNRNAKSYEQKYIILQGSRMGLNNYLSSDFVPSYRAISYITGKELWRYNSVRTRSYSRDVDGSALFLNDTAYLGLENGKFIVFNPDPEAIPDSLKIKQPIVYEEHPLYVDTDPIKHGGNLVTESSPSKLGNRIYISSGSGHIWGYNLKTRKIDWDFYTGSDIDGSPVVTDDSCIIVSIEKEYITGNAGVFKLDPSKPPEDAVVWFFPTPYFHFVFWDGGIIGSVGINDYYKKENDSMPNLAAFLTIDEHLYVVDHKTIDSTKTAIGPDNKTKYYQPKLVFKYHTGSSISTPLIINNRIIAATYEGLYLFEFDKNLKFNLIDYKDFGSFEATPFVYNKRVFIAARNGFLYCLGNQNPAI